MAELIGGVAIEKYNFTKAFGVGPASASGVCVGDPGLAVGDYVVFSFGAISFYGVVSQLNTPVSTSEGLKYHFGIVDNRIRLAWQTVAGMWNMEEPVHGDSNRVRPEALVAHYSNTTGLNGSDDLDTSAGVEGSSGVDGVSLSDTGPKPEGRRRYAHILPQHHESQLKTYTDNPLTCAEILSSAFKGAWGSYNFTRNYHTSQNNTALLNIDANNGMVLAGFVSMMNSHIGLDMTIDGANSLRWERKGDGVFIPPADVLCLDDQGEALSHVPTKVEIIGDKNTVQVLNVPLEPDWASGWEKFLSEVAWVDEVDVTFGPYPATQQGAAERAARAREVTLSEYIVAKGDSTDLIDIRCWGDIGRMDLPVWIYINEILYKSYRIKPDYELYGVPLDSLELMDGLLCSCELEGAGATAKIRYRRNPVELYPAAKAYVAGKGQPLDMLDKRTYELFSTQRTKNLREEFSSINEFDVDKLHKSFHFNTPIFIDGDPAADKSIFLYPNKGKGGYTDVSGDLGADSDYLSIVVPNPGYEIAPSDILVSVAWGIAKFKRRYGSGVRRTVYQAPDICEHVLDMGDDSGFSASGALAVPVNPLGVSDPPAVGGLRTILYEDGSTADERAEEMVSSLILRNAVETSGSYRRYGFAGTVLSGIHDRVSISVDFQNGIVETVSFEKALGTQGFESERVREGRLVNADLYSGQQELKKEVRQLRIMAKYANKSKSANRSDRHKTLPDVFTQPIGDQMASTTYVAKSIEVPESATPVLAGAPWKAGHVVWLDDSGSITASGKRLGGIVTMGEVPSSPRAQLNMAKSGVVPCLVKGPFSGGDSIGCDDGENICTVGGSKAVGKIDHSGDYTGEEVMIVNCRISAASAVSECPLGSLTADPDNVGKLKITPGYVHGGGTSILLELNNITATIGDKVYVKVGWTATAVDDVLMTGGTMTTAIIEQSSADETDDEFTKDSLTGFHWRVLGEWIDDGNANPQWVKDGCGSYNVKMCSNGVTGTFLGARGD